MVLNELNKFNQGKPNDDITDPKPTREKEKGAVKTDSDIDRKKIHLGMTLNEDESNIRT